LTWPENQESLCTPQECDISRINFLAIPIALIAGAIAAAQAFISGELAKNTDSLWSGIISNLGALLTVSLFLFSYKFRSDLKEFILKLKTRVIPIWILFGGFFGAIYVATSAYAVATLGAGLFTIGVVASANISSLIVDRLGFGSVKSIRLSPLRLFAALLAIFAVAIAVYNPDEDLLIMPLIVVLIAGVAQIFQVALNSKLAIITNPQVATFINFPIALLAGALFIFGYLSLGNEKPNFPNTWWLYVGGLLGASFVLIAAWLVKKMGVLVFTLATISGQLVTALFLDYLFLAVDLGWQILVGAFMVLIAAYFARDVR